MTDMVEIPRLPLPGDDGEDDIERGSPDEKNLVAEIDVFLASHQPDRVGKDDYGWHDAFMAEGLDILSRTPSDSRDRDYLGRLMRTRDGVRARRARAAFTLVTQTDQLDIKWDTQDFRRDILRCPLIVEGIKIRFGALTVADLTAWLLESARKSDERNKREASEREGAQRLLRLLSDSGAQRIEDMRPSSGEGAA